MNREIVGGGGASIYPLQGDIKSTPGSSLVSVTGIQGIPVQQTFPTDKEVLTYDGASNTLILEAPVSQIELETNGTPNSTQTLLNIVAGTNMTITESGGAVTFVANGSGATRGVLNTNANGNWWVWSDGIIESWGSLSVPPNTASVNTGVIVFPFAYTTAVQSIQVSIVGLPRLANADSASVQISGLSLTTAGINLQCSVPVGGGGVTFDQAVIVHWRAIGV